LQQTQHVRLSVQHSTEREEAHKAAHTTANDIKTHLHDGHGIQ